MHRHCLALIVATLFAGPVHADNWPQWRGPRGDGSVPGSGYPTKWSDTENVLWKVALPGWGTSTPAVWENRIFVTHDGDEEGAENALACLDLDGNQVWQVKLGRARAARQMRQ